MAEKLKSKDVPVKSNVVPFPADKVKPASDKNIQEIIDFIKDKKKGCPAIADALGNAKLKEIAEKRGFSEIKRITEALNTALYGLVETDNHYTAKEKLLKPETLELLYGIPVFKSEQLSYAIWDLAGNEDFKYAIEKFVDIALENIHLNILWKPLVDELSELDGVGATSYFLNGEHIDYMKKWDERIALFDEARERFGLDDYVKLRSGVNVALYEGDSFSTTANGRIYNPPYVSIYPDKERNLKDYRLSNHHECGHHKWRSFRINMRILDFGIVGAEFIGEKMAPDGKKVFMVAHEDKEGKRKTSEITRYEELIQIVKYPKLLAWLHNVADDKRIDALNMLDVSGIAEEYRENNEHLLTKRPKIDKGNLKNVLEGLLQVTVVGETHGEPDENLKARLEQIRSDLSEMEIHNETDGTDSMNVALRWYKALEPELDELAKRVKNESELEKELGNMLPGNFTNSETEMGGEGSKIVDEDAGNIIISKNKKPRPQPRSKGMDPFQFLDFGNQSESGDDDSDGGGSPGGESGSDPSSCSGPGKKKPDGKPNGANGKPETGGKDEKEGHAYDEWSGNGYRRGTKIVYEKQFDSSAGRIITVPNHLVRRTRRIFKKYMPKEGVLVRGLDAGEIDPELLEDYIAQVDAGRFPEPNFHSDVIHERTNTAVQVVIDGSGSMTWSANARVKLDVAAEGAALISNTSYLMRFPNETGLFTGGDTVDYYVLPTTKYSITLPSNVSGATPMAGAVRHANVRALQLKKTHRKRFVYQFWVCDGEPNCSGEGIDSVVDTGKAIEEARVQGIKAFGIVIADEQHKKQYEEDFKKIFGPRWYVVTTDVNRIPDLLLGFLSRVIYHR